jgi:hypothetical protein
MRKAHSRTVRAKLSTTVAWETYEFLKEMVSSGQVASIAEAVDAVIATVRRAENRKALAAATAHYFDQLSPEAAAQENALGREMASAGSGIDFDREI